jgi:hypothetical protein
MSGSWYEHLADTWQDSKIDGLGMFNPQELVEESMKMDSRGVESLAKKWNLGGLEQEAHGNVSNPAMGIGKASTAAAASMAGGWLGNLFGGAGTAGGAVPPMAEMGGPIASQVASQMGLQSGQAAGLMGTMESALMDSGYTPSSLMNAAKYGPESGQTFGQTMGNWAGNKADTFMTRLQHNPKGLLSGQRNRFAMNQAADMMTPQQQMQPPPRPMQYQQDPLQNPYGQQDPNLTEEQKMQLRMMGYSV